MEHNEQATSVVLDTAEEHAANKRALNVRLVSEPLDLPPLSRKQRTVLVAVLAAIGVVSLLVLGWLFSTPSTFQGIIDTLDEKRNNVMLLMSSAAGLSSAITFIPDDACTPVANELADLSSDFLVVLVAIYLEKYALTVLGFVTFRLLIPISCALGIAVVFLEGRPGLRQTLLRLSSRLAVLGLALFLVVPASVGIANLIDATYETSVAETIGAADQATQDIEGAQEGTDSSWSPLEFLSQVPEKVTGLIDSAKNALGDLVEAFAIMLITSCVIPVLVLLFFLWLVRVILGANINLPLKALGSKIFRGK